MIDSEPSPRTSRPGRILAYSAIAVAIHALAVTLGLMFPIPAGYATKKKPTFAFDDIKLYHRWTSPMLEGRWPYRDYRVEYPVLAIPAFAAPLLVAKEFSSYKIAFVVEMCLFDALLTWLVARQVERSSGIARVPWRLAWYSAFFLVICPLVVLRFDLVPTLLTFAAACLMASGRKTLGGVAAGLGVLVKLVPVVVMPPLLAIPGDLKGRVKSLLAFGLTIGLGVAGWWRLGGAGMLETFRYHGERGLEIESLAASAYMVANKLFGVVIISFFDHGGVNIGGPGAGDAARLSTIVQAALLLLVVAKAWKAEPSESLRYAVAALLAFIIPGKVLSPQYMVWLLPFMAALDGPRATVSRWVFLVCCYLTTSIFPRSFGALIEFRTDTVVTLAARNLALIVLFFLLLGRGKSKAAVSTA